ncbi:MAG TPA: DUF1697 domain-containing protein [Candidatus Saccharimonadales bacterium]|nr:DUF1697 domain-containing protein [Candidatus Saccharimonadales bacterium]
MNRYAVFLRGINVGGRIIKMADLKACLEKAGLEDVKTLLQSGNVVFTSGQDSTAALKSTIETALSETFDYPAKVQVLTMQDLSKIVEKYPFGMAGDDQHDYVIFMENGLEKELAAESCSRAPREQVAAGPGVVYWRVDKGSTLKSDFAKLLAKSKYRQFNTNRNIRTLRKMLAL